MAFLRALSKMGLVQLSPEEMAALEKKSKKSGPEMTMAEIDKLLAEDAAAEAAPPPAAPTKKGPAPAAPARPAPAPAPRAPAKATTTTKPAPPPGVPIKAGPFDELYAAANVGASPYPAEQLLRLLDGLQAMDEQTRRMAVLAMDSADDSWTIADPVMDAKRKMRVLADGKTNLDATLAAAETAMKDEIAKLNAYEAEANKTIREKIASLEEQLANEVHQVSERRANLSALFERDRDAATAEHARFDAEVARLGTVPRHFETALRDAARAAG
ncbi:MAG: methyl-accepting chemotaxis protein [Deltaproteobacteria bacterium]|nr:methyl-accepting chemotaxis protein [Deltaproteobacteria bacterium]